jgi:hypothetical protein
MCGTFRQARPFGRGGFVPDATLLALLAGLAVLLAIFRRFARFGPGGDVDAYIRRHEEQARKQLAAMSLETRKFGAHEAMAPVEAGLLELLDLRGDTPPAIRLERVGDVLVVSAPGRSFEVEWRFRSPGRSAPPGSAHVYGKGQWEVRHAGNCEPYTRLNALMGRLSALVRDMAISPSSLP